MRAGWVVGLAAVVGLSGCTEKLELRIAELEERLLRVDQGLRANDQQMKAELGKLQAEADKALVRLDGKQRALESSIQVVRQKTDLICVEVTDTGGLRIDRAGYCGPR